ncbi:MAG: hypothetical protein SFZ23_11580 [Planctomycetota bacterium]|nr:hypothetical protein [Planctomycetota bacterium]
MNVRPNRHQNSLQFHPNFTQPASGVPHPRRLAGARRTIRAIIALALLQPLAGCIVWELRDELREANQQLTSVNTDLVAANARLDNANTRLDEANERLEYVEASLVRLDRTNELVDNVDAKLLTTNDSLGDTNAVLGTLRGQQLPTVTNSMTRLDAHLASLRKSLESLSDTVPFLDFGGDPVETTPGVPQLAEEPLSEPQRDPQIAAAPEGELATAPAAPGSQPEPSGPGEAPVSGEAGAPGEAADASSPAPVNQQKAGASVAQPQARPRPSPISGVWVSAYPDDRIAIILLPDGRFVRSTLPPQPGAGQSAGSRGSSSASTLSSSPSLLRGTWTLASGELRLSPEAPPPPAGQAATPVEPPASIAARVIQASARVLAIEDSDGLVIFRRP